MKFFDCSSERNTLSFYGNYIAVSIEICPGKDPTVNAWQRKNCSDVGSNDLCETWEPLTPKECPAPHDVFHNDKINVDGLFDEEINDINSIYPIELNFPAGLHSSTRLRRENQNKRDTASNNCTVPNNLDTAEVKCWVWPNWLHCHLHCINGFILDGKSRIDMNCRYSENKWKPTEFKECTAHVNCDTELKTPGKIWCRYNTMAPVICRISCSAYGSKPEVPPTEYICDGHFDPHLPHCVVDNVHSDMNEWLSKDYS